MYISIDAFMMMHTCTDVHVCRIIACMDTNNFLTSEPGFALVRRTVSVRMVRPMIGPPEPSVATAGGPPGPSTAL